MKRKYLRKHFRRDIKCAREVLKNYLKPEKLQKFLDFLSKDLSEDLSNKFNEVNIRKNYPVKHSQNDLSYICGKIWKHHKNEFLKNKLILKFYDVALPISRDYPESYNLGPNALVEDGMCCLKRVGYFYKSEY